MATAEEEVPGGADSGERRLNDIGYQQALRRDLTGASSYYLALSLFATPLTVTSLYTLGFYNGGPVTIIWGWLIVAFFSAFVVLSMAEILSSLPTAGGPYTQAFILGGEKWGPLASWWAGWLNWAAFVSGISSLNYIMAQFIGVMILLATGHYPSQRILFAIAGAAAVIETIFNLFPVRIVGFVATLGAVWTAIASLLLVVLIPSLAPRHQTFSYVFTTFYDNSAASGLQSPIYLFCVGLMMGQYLLLRFDANGHLSEETKGSNSSAAWAMVWAFVSTIISGFALLLAITFSIQDPNNVLNPDNQTGGAFAAPQIYYDVFYTRYGSGVGAIAVVGGITVCGIFGNTASLAAASRLLWAMGRDGAIPPSSMWAYLTPQGRVPLFSVLLTALLSLAFIAPVCWSPLTFDALTSFTAIATYWAYGVPILMKLLYGRARFEPGPLSLGRWSVFVNAVALLWICWTSVLFCLPPTFPVTWNTTNFAPITFGALFIVVTLPWLFPMTLFNFQGPPVKLWQGGQYSAVRRTSSARIRHRVMDE